MRRIGCVNSASYPYSGICQSRPAAIRCRLAEERALTMPFIRSTAIPPPMPAGRARFPGRWWPAFPVWSWQGRLAVYGRAGPAVRGAPACCRTSAYWRGDGVVEATPCSDDVCLAIIHGSVEIIPK
jgi:hypothetical protein